MTTYTVGYLIGSLSAESINRRLATALAKLAPSELELVEIGIKDLPLYNRDLDEDYPAAARTLKESIESADAILFVTPEYNRSIPGALKNAIDWASRPYGKNSFAGKPSAVIGASTGKIGTALAQHNLDSILTYLDSPQLNQPEAFIEFPPDLVDENGSVTVPSTEKFLSQFLEAFAGWIGEQRSGRSATP
jgi:chromate reductase